MGTVYRIVMACALAAGLLASTNAWAKRIPPADIPPVVSGTIRYEAPHFMTPCGKGQNGGCVAAYDGTSNTLLWAVKVYCTKYNPNLEADVQDVFITSLTLSSSNQLQIANEDGKHFTIDPATQKVSGDDTGCSESSSGGCNYGPGPSPRTPFVLVVFGLVGLVGVRRLFNGQS